MIRRAVLVSFGLSAPLFAQGTVPTNPGAIDYITWVTQYVDQLVTSGGTPFWSAGNRLLTSFGVTMLVLYGLQWMLISMSSHHHYFDYPSFARFIGVFMIAEFMMTYYDTPMPFGGVSFHQLLPETARTFAGYIDLTGLNVLLNSINRITGGAEQPSAWNPFMLVVYWTTLGSLILFQGVLFAVNVLGFVGLGVGTVFGPLMIPFLMIRSLSFLFWNWLSFMIMMSFFRVVAAAITYVWANVMVTFMQTMFHGDFTLAHFLLLLPALIVICIGMLFSILYSTRWTESLFKGSAGAASAMGARVEAFLRGSFA